ncbi:hypothetical protein BTO16_02095 [Polaribacter glomeratus]|uniref:Uncharacterized protein n=1 Tax=Polaribacter glomeratus TaxID=102 RepID=A0A2S7WVP3_9FLAO|nr:hypothetical protein BTO16_02095 [Polaribacter glomeratus]
MALFLPNYKQFRTFGKLYYFFKISGFLKTSLKNKGLKVLVILEIYLLPGLFRVCLSKKHQKKRPF